MCWLLRMGKQKEPPVISLTVFQNCPNEFEVLTTRHVSDAFITNRLCSSLFFFFLIIKIDV